MWVLVSHTPIPELINHSNVGTETRLLLEPLVKSTQPKPQGLGVGEGRVSRKMKVPIEEAVMGVAHTKPRHLLLKGN